MPGLAASLLLWEQEVNVWHRLVLAVTSLVFFTALNRLVVYPLTATWHLPPQHNARKGGCASGERHGSPRDDRLSLVNTLVSLAHSTICSLAMLFWGVVPDIMQTLAAGSAVEMLEGKISAAGLLTPLSLGYFLYDLMDMSRYRLPADMLVHHVFAIAFTALVLLLRLADVFWLLVLTCEFNSVFLHLRTILKLSGVPRDGALFAASLAGLFITFAWTRLYIHGRGLWYTLQLLRTATSPMHQLVAAGGIVGGGIVWLLNLILLRSLVRSVWRGRRCASSADAEGVSTGGDTVDVKPNIRVDEPRAHQRFGHHR